MTHTKHCGMHDSFDQKFNGMTHPPTCVRRYSILHPIISLVGVFYFAIGYVVSKYQLLMVYTPVCESGGTNWHRIFKFVIIAVSILLLRFLFLCFLVLFFVVPLQSQQKQRNLRCWRFRRTNSEIQTAYLPCVCVCVCVLP